MKNNKPKIATLCFVVKDNQVLLGMKKKGFGKGRWNGFGGKVKKNEKISQAAQRELLEESNIKAERVEKIGRLDFFCPKEYFGMIVHIFICEEYQRKPKETDEMTPKWFDLDKIPFEKMWPDDIYWFSHLLERKKFEGKFIFEDFDNIKGFEIKLI